MRRSRRWATLGRERYQRGSEGRHRNGYRPGHVEGAEGRIKVEVPQVRGIAGYSSALVEFLGDHSEVLERLAADAGPDKTIVSGECTTLEGSASGGVPPYSYSWLPETGLSDPNIAQPTACPTETTTYTLTVTDDDGASDTAIARIRVGEVAGPPNLRFSHSNVRWEGKGACILAIDLTAENIGVGPALGVAIRETRIWGRASLVSPAVPIELGDIPAGGSAVVTLRFQVAAGIRGFMVALRGDCQDAAGGVVSFGAARIIRLPR